MSKISLNREVICQQVINTLQLAVKCPGEQITLQTDPFQDLGLDSVDGINVACVLSARLGVEIPEDNNPLVDDEKNKPRLVGEIVDWCCRLVKDDQEVEYVQS